MHRERERERIESEDTGEDTGQQWARAAKFSSLTPARMPDDDEFYIKYLNTCNLTFVSAPPSGHDVLERVFLF